MYILKKKYTILIICFVFLISFTIYHIATKKHISTEPETKLSICTSIYPIYDFTRSVCGESDDVFCIVPKGSDFRTWYPSENDIEKICQADVFIFSGKGAEPWLNDLFPILAEHDVKLVNTSKDITEESSTGYIWLNPNNALVQMKEIYNFLITENPENENFYKMNMAIFTEKFQKLDQMIEEETSQFPNKQLYVTSQLYDSFCLEYGFSQIPSWNIDTFGNFLPQDVESIRTFITENNIHAIYTEPQNTAYALKELLGKNASVLTFDPFIINRTDDSYFNVMESNILMLKKGQMASIYK